MGGRFAFLKNLRAGWLDLEWSEFRGSRRLRRTQFDEPPLEDASEQQLFGDGRQYDGRKIGQSDRTRRKPLAEPTPACYLP